MDRPATADSKPRDPGAVIGALALAVGGLWIAGGLAATVVLVGFDRMLALRPVEAGALPPRC